MPATRILNLMVPRIISSSIISNVKLEQLGIIISLILWIKVWICGRFLDSAYILSDHTSSPTPGLSGPIEQGVPASFVIAVFSRI